MALSNGNATLLYFDGLPFDGSVRCVAAPSWARPCFAIPLVSLGPHSNALYMQEIDGLDLITGLSPFDVPDEALLTLSEPVTGLDRGTPSIHAVIGPEGEILAGSRSELSPTLATWLPQIAWPVTRLTFADFIGDERQVMAAAVAALKDTSDRQGRHQASVWFATSVVFRRLQRGRDRVHHRHADAFAQIFADARQERHAHASEHKHICAILVHRRTGGGNRLVDGARLLLREVHHRKPDAPH